MTNKLDRLQLITTFLAIAETGNLTAAAKALGTTQPTVSRRLKDLEQLLGVRLAGRTTHRFYLTDEGQELQRRAITWADVWSEWQHDLKGTADVPRGKLTIAGPQGYGYAFLMEAVAVFRKKYPQVEVDLRVSDRPIDIVGQGIDCWIRVGGSRDETLHVRPIGEMRRFLIASTSFARKHTLKTPQDLSNVPFVGLIPHVLEKVVLISRANGARVTVPISTPVATDGLLASYRAVRSGLGIAGASLWMCENEIKAGSISRILPGWELPPIAIEAVSVAGRFRPARIDAFVNILCDVMSELDGFVPSR